MSGDLFWESVMYQALGAFLNHPMKWWILSSSLNNCIVAWGIPKATLLVG